MFGSATVLKAATDPKKLHNNDMNVSFKAPALGVTGGGSPCGYDAHQLNSWCASRLKRAASLTEGQRAQREVKNSNNTEQPKSSKARFLLPLVSYGWEAFG